MLQVAAATRILLVACSATSAAVEFALEDLLPYTYAGIYFAVSLGAAPDEKVAGSCRTSCNIYAALCELLWLGSMFAISGLNYA